MRVTSPNHAFFLLCAMFLSGGQALAQDSNDDRPRPPEHGQGDGPRGEHRRPPEAAFTACADLKQDDACEVQFHDQKIAGKCVQAREEDKLVCRPDHMPDHPHGPPPNAQ